MFSLSLGDSVFRLAVFSIACLLLPALLVCLLVGHGIALVLAPALLFVRHYHFFKKRSPDDLWMEVPAGLRLGLTRSSVRDYPYLLQAIDHLPLAALGPSTLLVMVLDPQVSLAVRAHSTYLDAPIRRLLETLRLVLALTESDEASQRRATKYIHGKHASIHGHGYSAKNMESQAFVWSCLVLSIEEQYRSVDPESHYFVAANGEQGKRHLETLLDEIYKDWRNWGRAFGVSDRWLPLSRKELHAQHKATLDAALKSSNADTAGFVASRQVIQGLFDLSKTWFLFPLVPLAWYANALSVGELPSTIQNCCPELCASWQTRFASGSFRFLWWNTPYVVRRGLLRVQNALGAMLPLPRGT